MKQFHSANRKSDDGVDYSHKVGSDKNLEQKHTRTQVGIKDCHSVGSHSIHQIPV